MVKTLSILILIAACSGQSVYAGLLNSASYSFDYATFAAGGGDTQSASFSIMGQVKTQGLANAKTTSSNYQIEPVTASQAPAHVSDWCLY